MSTGDGQVQIDEEDGVNFEVISQGGGDGDAAARERAMRAMEMLREHGLGAMLDELCRAKRVVRPAQAGRSVSWVMPELSALRQAMRAESAEMTLAMDRADWERFALGFERLLALGRHESNEPMAIGYLVGNSIALHGMSRVRELVSERTLEAADLRRLIGAMERQLPLAPVTVAFEGERVMHLDVLQMVYEDPQQKPEQRIVEMAREFAGVINDVEKEEVEPILRLFTGGDLATYEEAKQLAESVFGRMVAASRSPAHERMLTVRAIMSEEVPRKQFVMSLMQPAFDKATIVSLQSEAAIAGTRAVLAVELHRAEKGSYPAALEELVPTYLKGVPVDPYTGESLKFRRFAEKDADGRAYVLYSVGLDGEDDGGKVHPDRQDAAAYEKGAGFDLVWSGGDGARRSGGGK